MAAQTVIELLDAAQRSGLLTVDDVQRLTQELETIKLLTATEAAEKLVERESLTQLQVDLLLADRGQSCVLAGRFQLRAKLGEGAMGAVYQALDTKLDRLVAIKVLPPHSLDDPDAVARFQREAKALAKLSHPNVIQAHDVGEDQGRHFVVMDYIEGKNLHKLLQEGGPLPPARAADYICQAALGLQHAHEKGLVHRDLKPSNLIVTPDRQVKIVDLGLARFFQDQLRNPQLTREGIGMGTPDYMPPEQFHDARTADPRADIYSLGCTFYHLLTGEPPFPGSSLREKCEAHESRLPPLAEKCPDAPAALVEVAMRMMAKQPSARYQTALDVAHALAPHVAGASASNLQTRATSSWKAERPTSLAGQSRKRKWSLRLAITLAVVAPLLGLASLIGPRLIRDPEVNGRSLPRDNLAPESVRAPLPPATVVTIPNGLTVAKDGTGQFASIREALAQVRSGQTIRVLDRAVYDEALLINSRSSHAGVTLESTQGATIETAIEGRNLVEILGVPQFTLRGFRLRARGEPLALVLVKHACPGLLLERLRMESGVAIQHAGVEVLDCNLNQEDPPLVVQDCELRDLAQGIVIVGCGHPPRYSVPYRTSRLVLRNNRLSNCMFGIVVMGDARQVQVVGNLFLHCLECAMQLDNLVGSPQQVLLANNTMFECPCALRYWDSEIRGQGIEVKNNLILAATGLDMHWMDNGGDAITPKGPGDGAALSKAWQFGQNWREAKPPEVSEERKAWIPPTDQDRRLDQIAVMSRENENADFLRPAADSPLANEGAGKEDPTLPIYVGSIAPAGVEPWDWSKTWDARHKHLFTVSQDPKDGGEYRSIKEALASIRPNTIIRVLDKAVYQESISLGDAKKHGGLAIESPLGATLEAPPRSRVVFSVQDVPGAVLRGFTIADGGLLSAGAYIRVGGKCAGVRLENLRLLESKQTIYGMLLDRVQVAAEEPPLLIRRCTIEASGMSCDSGIRIIGSTDNAAASSGMLIVENRIFGAARGIVTENSVAQVCIAANLIWSCPQSGITITDPGKETVGLRLVNNTLFENTTGLRFYDQSPYETFVGGQIELRNNLFVEARNADLCYLQLKGGILATVLGGAAPEPRDSTGLYGVWRVEHNWRDLSGNVQEVKLALAPGDHQAPSWQFISRDPQHDDFMRPPKDAPYALEGAGKDDDSMPNYVGAVPPAGAEAWDWQKHWSPRTVIQTETRPGR